MNHRFELRPGHIAALFAALALGFSWVMPERGAYGVDICAFHALTGIPCPGCGMTRAFRAIGHGAFAQAWRLNPFAFPLYVACGLCLLAPFTPLPWQRHQRSLAYAGIGLSIAMAAFGLARMAKLYPWP